MANVNENNQDDALVKELRAQIKDKDKQIAKLTSSVARLTDNLEKLTKMYSELNDSYSSISELAYELWNNLEFSDADYSDDCDGDCESCDFADVCDDCEFDDDFEDCVDCEGCDEYDTCDCHGEDDCENCPKKQMFEEGAETYMNFLFALGEEIFEGVEPGKAFSKVVKVSCTEDGDIDFSTIMRTRN